MAYRERLGGRGSGQSGLLIVDSDVLVRQGLADYLRHCGYRVVEAESMAAALHLLDARTGAPPVDLVLCDAELADGSGFALRARVKKIRPDIPVVLAASVESAARAAGELCDDGPHLARPYDPQTVADRIRRLLGQRTR